MPEYEFIWTNVITINKLSKILLFFVLLEEVRPLQNFDWVDNNVLNVSYDLAPSVSGLASPVIK